MPGRTPDYRYVFKTITVPAGTAQASPLKTSVDLGQVTLIAVQVRIPNGHSGDTGIAVVSDNFGIVPWDPAVSYLIGNDEQPTFDVDMTMGHAISVWTYNTGEFVHRFYLRFKVRDTSLDTAIAGPTVAVVKDAQAIEDAGATTTAVLGDDGSMETADATSGALADAAVSGEL